MTKEQLLIEATQLKQSNEALVAEKERTRKEFAKAFNWYLSGQYEFSRREPKIPSWEEIFVEIGRLRAARTFTDNYEKIVALEQTIERLEKMIVPEKTNLNS